MAGSVFSEWALEIIVTVAGTFITFAFGVHRVVTTWNEHQEKERELWDRSDKRLNDRLERNSIRTNFDLQRARMRNLQTPKLIAFSPAAAAEVNKRKQAEMIERMRKQEEQAMIGHINNSTNGHMPGAWVYGEDSDEFMRQMNERRAERALVRPQWPHTEQVSPASPEPLAHVRHEMEGWRRTGGFTSQ